MNKMQFRHLLACYICKQSLTFRGVSGYCPRCKVNIKLINGIWHSLGKLSLPTQKAKKQYDILFSREFGGPNDGSYDILAKFAKGNLTADISCGPGMLTSLDPQIVGVDFSFTALNQAKKNGAKHLVLADAHALPFKNNAFELAISAGNLEHFENPQLAVDEMARISKKQLLIVHKYPPIPFAKQLFWVATKLFKINHQPIERPLHMAEVERMCIQSGLRIIFKGVWTLPTNYGRVIPWLPELKFIPSALFIIATKI